MVVEVSTEESNVVEEMMELIVEVKSVNVGWSGTPPLFFPEDT